MTLSRGGWFFIQATSRGVPHGAVDGGRSHGGALMRATMGMTGDNDSKDGAHREADEPRWWRDDDDLGGHEGAALTISRYQGGDPEV